LRSKTLLIILAVVTLALFGAYYVLGTGLVKQRHDNQALASQLDEKSSELSRILTPSQNLDAKLAEAQQNLADAIGIIPTDLSSTLVINDILKLAEACEVKAVLLTANPWTDVSNEQGYRVFKITISLEGDFDKVHFFLHQLENVEFESIIIEGLNVSRDNSDSDMVHANLSLAIYSRYTPGK
jgi:hypothetical protein